jgi:hypothetical protein
MRANPPGSKHQPIFNLRMLTSTFRYDTVDVENKLYRYIHHSGYIKYK